MGKEIRKAIQGEKGKKGEAGLILEKTDYAQKYHLVTRDSQVQPGDFVWAVIVWQQEKYALYKCIPIPQDRMVVEVIMPRGCCPNSAIYYWEKVKESVTAYFEPNEIEPFIEICTEHSSSHNFRGKIVGDYRQLSLIKKGAEKRVKGIFIKSQFRYFVLEKMRIWNLHANNPKFQCDKRLKTREDFENAWKKYSPDGLFSEYATMFSPWESKPEGTASSLESLKSGWDIVVPHLAAWTYFAARIQQLEINELSGQLLSYLSGGGVNHYCCLNPLLEKATQFFSSVADITKDRVMQFLAQTESVFPSIPESSR